MEIYKGLDVGMVLERGASAVPDKVAVVDGERRITYRELNAMADALACSFSALGFEKGDRVAIYMKSSIEFIVTFYALEKLGVIVAWVNPNYRRAEAEFILRNSGAKGVAVFREWDGYDYLEAIRELRGNLPELEKIILVGEGEGEGVHRFEDLVEQGRSGTYSRPVIRPEEDLAMLIYTSGTTGRPKGAMITHYQSVRAGWQYSLGVKATSEDVFLGVLPMSHSYGCGALLIQPLLLQSTLVLMEKFEPEKAFSLIEKEKVTLQPAAPAHYILELNHPARKKYDLSSLRAGLIAGQVAPEGLITEVEREMNVYLTSFWGASEVGPGVGIMCPYPSSLEVREAYIGRPIADTRVRVVDPETREELPEGQVGELTLSGWHVLKGYWRNPEETRKQIIDGWLHMGDLVSREKDDYFKIYGRTKDLINRGGYKIYPYELESLLADHPDVEEVCVVATPNPVLGESTCACVIPKPGHEVTLKSLRDFLKGKVAPHKLPDELCVMSSFPRLSGGVKLNKFGKGGIAELARQDEHRERYRN
ncbi:MAG: acyl--CoA ligase [Deltaproteobacteria bacterium]|nr:acyl--CoA ligase [Deltaproteobacteria bacterium]MBW2128064.1 acyl--CoA ligase [Deltaproteobacteria bacterium]MBW2304084.1 acyl--CoA ligase [Deltaproteobacteria bacterium]